MRPDHHSGALLRRAATAGVAAVLILAGSAAADTLPLPAGPVQPTPTTTSAPSLATAVAQPQGAVTSQATAGRAMVGTFRLAAATCSGSVKGSNFRMIQPGGAATGPFVTNSDSPCSDSTYTPMSPGTDHGLKTGSFQAEPSPAFDGSGNGLADRITKPQKFFGANFASATNPTDPQTSTKVTAPTILVDGSGHLSGDLRAFAASWNGQHFNQGSPKPDGSAPGLTTPVTGTYNETTKAFVLDWTSQIVGGPFNNFTGKWHLEGTFDGTVAATPTTISSGGGGSNAASSVSGSAATSGSTGRRNPSLANTGLSVATDRGLLLLAAGLLGLTVVGRARRPHPQPGGPSRG